MEILFSVTVKFSRFGFYSLIVGLSGELIFKSGLSGLWRRHLYPLFFLLVLLFPIIVSLLI